MTSLNACLLRWLSGARSYRVPTFVSQTRPFDNLCVPHHENVDDVLDELGPLVEAAQVDSDRVVRHPAELLLNEIEQAVLGKIGTEPTSIDQIVYACKLPVHRVLSTISVLEMRRLVRRVSGTLVARM
jgi:DNA processing protein